MSIQKFNKSDIFINQLKTTPYVRFYYSNTLSYYEGDFLKASSSTDTNRVNANLYELNQGDRAVADLIYPFVTKNGTRSTFKTISTSSFVDDFDYGDTLSGSYPMTSSVYSEFYNTTTRAYVSAMQNTLNFYRKNSPHYAYSSSLGNKSSQNMKFINVPSIFYGSSIAKGSVELDYYVTGTLIARLNDSSRNGELIQSSGTAYDNDGLVAGVVLYNEGIILLTGSWNLGPHTEDYVSAGSAVQPTWLYYLTTTADGQPIHSSSYELKFKGTNYIPVITMMAHAKKGMMNNSMNPSFIDFTSASSSIATYSSGSKHYSEPAKMKIKNTVKSTYTNHTASFEKQTYISKVGIYDKDKNLIAIAKLAQPLRKRETDEFTIKMKLDI